MDHIPNFSWTNIAIALLIALISALAMGAFFSKNQMPVEGKVRGPPLPGKQLFVKWKIS